MASVLKNKEGLYWTVDNRWGSFADAYVYQETTLDRCFKEHRMPTQNGFVLGCSFVDAETERKNQRAEG